MLLQRFLGASAPEATGLPSSNVNVRALSGSKRAILFGQLVALTVKISV